MENSRPRVSQIKSKAQVILPVNEYMGISASWELGFTDYNLVVLEGEEKNIENGLEISDPKEVEEYATKLKGFGGEGKFDESSSIYSAK